MELTVEERNIVIGVLNSLKWNAQEWAIIQGIVAKLNINIPQEENKKEDKGGK